MKTLTVELPDDEVKLFMALLKKLKGKIIDQTPIPNEETIKAMKELKEGKGKKFENVDALFNSI